MEVNQDILNQLQCWYCNKAVSYGPVLLSSEGKNVCGRCRAPMKPDGEIFLRNLYYEKIASVHKFPCKNNEMGCSAVLEPKLLKTHEEICTYNTVGCPTHALDNKCSWSGHFYLIEEHYKEKHPELIVQHPLTEKPDIKRSYMKILLFTLSGFAFLLQRKCDVAKNTLWHNVLLLGPPHMASFFKYTVILKNGLDLISKVNPVKPYGSFVMCETDSIKHRINNIFQELGDYDDTDFHLSVSMQKLDCCRCSTVMTSGPIYTEVEGQYYCATCKQAEDKTTQNDISTVSTSKYPTHIELDQGNSRQTDCTLCLECGTEYKGKENMCDWCMIPRRLKETSNITGQHKCPRSGNGCTYTHTDSRLIHKHMAYMCMFDDRACGACGEQYLDKRLIDHVVQKHVSVVRAEVTGTEATADIRLTRGFSRYLVHIHGLQLYIHADRSSDYINLGLLTVTEKRGHDLLSINCIISIPHSEQTTSHSLRPNNDYSDWWNRIVLRNMAPGEPPLNMRLRFKIKNVTTNINK